MHKLVANPESTTALLTTIISFIFHFLLNHSLFTICVSTSPQKAPGGFFISLIPFLSSNQQLLKALKRTKNNKPSRKLS